MYPLSKTGGDGVVALLHSSKLENNIPLTLNRVREAVRERDTTQIYMGKGGNEVEPTRASAKAHE
jgi:hypothetical protein